MKRLSTAMMCFLLARLGVYMAITLNPPATLATLSPITKIEKIALNVIRLELEPTNAKATFLCFDPGAPIDAHLPTGLVGKCSLRL